MYEAQVFKTTQTDSDPAVIWFRWFWSLTDEQRNAIRRERGEQQIEEADDDEHE